MRKEYIQPSPTLDQLKGQLRRLQQRRKFWQTVRSTLGSLTVAAAIVVLLANLWLPVLQVAGGSMAPTLEEGDIVVCVKSRQIAPGNLVAFYLGNKLLVKRCIAGPGQQVDMDETGAVYIDGQLLAEPYASDLSRGAWDVDFPLKVPQEQLFCLGDRRSTSVDSRYEAVGCVPRSQVLGKPVLRIWPLAHFGWLTKGGENP